AVDLVAQRLAPPLEVRMVREHAVGVLREPDGVRHAQPPAAQRAEHVVVALEGRAPNREDLVGDEVERALRRVGRVGRGQRAGRRVARVRERLLAVLEQPAVQLLERAHVHHHLAAHGEQPRRAPAVQAQPQRHGRDRPRVRRDVLAAPAVAARDRTGEHAVLVDQLDGRTVQLGLQDEACVAGSIAAHAGDEARDDVALARRLEAGHGRYVLDRPELRGRLARDALRGRVGRDQVGEALFDALQRVEQAVVLLVRDLRPVEDVVEVVVVADLAAQPFGEAAGLRPGQRPDLGLGRDVGLAGTSGGHAPSCRGACGVPRAAGIRRRACVLRGGREPGSRRGGRDARTAQERYHGGSYRDRPMLELTDNARRVLDARYLRRDAERRIIETPEQLFARVARAVAHAELVLGNAEQAARWEAEFHALLTRLEFLPNTPTLMNAGTPLGQLAACFVLPVG